MKKTKNFKQYNDYELLYLINEGNEYALNIFFEKYDSYIKKIIYELCHYIGDDFEDLVQEGRMVLYKCIKMYKPINNTSFFTYFSLSLKRKIIRLLCDEYQAKPILSESLVEFNTSEYKIKITGDMFFNDPLKIKLFNSCIINDMTLNKFAKDNNMTYDQVYYLNKKIIEELRKLFGVK